MSFLLPEHWSSRFSAACATFALHCRSWLSLKSQIQVVMSLYLSQYFVRGCLCGRGGRVCALAVSPGWPLAPSRSLPHRHHYQRESWTGESPRSHPAPTPPRVHLPIVFWPWLTLHPPRIYFLAILFVSIPFSCYSSRFSVFSPPASPPGRLPRQP